jgi:hypothetical protein
MVIAISTRGIRRNCSSSGLIKLLQFTSKISGKSSNFHRRQLGKLPFKNKWKIEEFQSEAIREIPLPIEWKFKRNMEVSFND